MLLKLVITSQSGLALLLLPTVFPILMALGINNLTAASVLCLICIDWGPNDGSTIFAASVAKMDVVTMFTNYQVFIVASVMLVLAVIIPIYYKHMDKKDIQQGITKKAEKSDLADPDCPAFYAVLPLIPLVIVFSGSFIPNIKIDVVTANFIGLAIVFIIEFIRRKNRREIPNDIVIVLKAMGNSFLNVVSIIIAASVFAEGIKALGGISILANLLADLRGASLITILLITLITFGAAVLMGSGAASLYAFAPLVPGIATNLGINSLSMIVPMELGTAIGRGMSPVAGATIAISGYADIDTMKVVKRTTIPLIIALVVNIAVSYFMF
jgi:DcuC family C4-dicarboxylate transporter